MRRLLFILIFITSLLGFFSCSSNQTSKTESPKELTPQDQATQALANKGKSLYQSNCTNCHSADPSQEGPVGPALKGSSKELIEARVLRASYPQGYEPQRPTHIMPSFPYLSNDIDALAAYLANP